MWTSVSWSISTQSSVSPSFERKSKKMKINWKIWLTRMAPTQQRMSICVRPPAVWKFWYNSDNLKRQQARSWTKHVAKLLIWLFEIKHLLLRGKIYFVRCFLSIHWGRGTFRKYTIRSCNSHTGRHCDFNYANESWVIFLICTLCICVFKAHSASHPLKRRET